MELNFNHLRFMENEAYRLFRNFVASWPVRKSIPFLSELKSMTSGSPAVCLQEAIPSPEEMEHLKKRAIVIADCFPQEFVSSAPHFWIASSSMNGLDGRLSAFSGQTQAIVTNLTPASVIKAFSCPVRVVSLEHPAFEGIAAMGLMPPVTGTSNDPVRAVVETLGLRVVSREEAFGLPELSFSSKELIEKKEENSVKKIQDLYPLCDRIENIINVLSKDLDEYCDLWFRHPPVVYADVIRSMHADHLKKTQASYEELTSKLPPFIQNILTFETQNKKRLLNERPPMGLLSEITHLGLAESNGHEGYVHWLCLLREDLKSLIKN